MNFTFLKSDLARYIFELHGVTVNTALILKVQIKERPIIIFGAVITFFTIVFGFAVQIFEEGIVFRNQKKNNVVLDMFSEVANSMWCIILAMTTVGYGDIVPNSNIGRLFVVIGSIIGTSFIPLIVITLQAIIRQEEHEENAYKFMLSI
jgi:hypothetical protein